MEQHAVRTTTFERTFHGYDPAQVDRYLEVVADAWAAGAQPHEMLRAAGDAGFDDAAIGYRKNQVNAFVDELVGHWRGRADEAGLGWEIEAAGEDAAGEGDVHDTPETSEEAPDVPPIGDELRVALDAELAAVRDTLTAQLAEALAGAAARLEERVAAELAEARAATSRRVAEAEERAAEARAEAAEAAQMRDSLLGWLRNAPAELGAHDAEAA